MVEVRKGQAEVNAGGHERLKLLNAIKVVSWNQEVVVI